LDALLGEPRRSHPLVLFGRLADGLERQFNGPDGRGWRSHGVTAWCLAVLPLSLCAWLLSVLPGIGSAINLAKEGKLKALAVSTAKRATGAPDIPTIAESGIPGFDVATWESVQAPAGTPPDVVARLNAAIRDVVAAKELRQKMVGLGFEPDATKSPAETAQFIGAERQKWARLVKERNIKAE